MQDEGEVQHLIFGNLYFALTPFFYNSLYIVRPTLSGIALTCSFSKVIRLANGNLDGLQSLVNNVQPYLLANL